MKWRDEMGAYLDLVILTEWVALCQTRFYSLEQNGRQSKHRRSWLRSVADGLQTLRIVSLLNDLFSKGACQRWERMFGYNSSRDKDGGRYQPLKIFMRITLKYFDLHLKLWSKTRKKANMFYVNRNYNSLRVTFQNDIIFETAFALRTIVQYTCRTMFSKKKCCRGSFRYWTLMPE